MGFAREIDKAYRQRDQKHVFYPPSQKATGTIRSNIFYMSFFTRSIFAICLIFLSACAEAPSDLTLRGDSISQSSGYPVRYPLTKHTVAQGETLWRISKIYQVDLDDLIRTNNISDSKGINAGQTLSIPVKRRGPVTNFTSKDSAGDFIWPSKGKVIRFYNEKVQGVNNKGIDIDLAGGDRIIASREGKVIFVGKLPGYGDTVILDHRDGLASVYCAPGVVSARLGEEIKQGFLLSAPVPVSGGVLHFEIRKNNKTQNPLYYLD